MFNLQQLVRPNIWSLAPYSSARDEYSGHEATVFLDANENPYNKPFNRYPDSLQHELKAELAKVPSKPMRLAGTWQQYSKKAIPHEKAITPIRGQYLLTPVS